MAQFGVTTALTSIVLSAFMAGLGLGSWLSGHLIRKFGGRVGFPILRLYALTELLIGASAILVPIELVWGRALLERVSLTSSASYYLACGVWIALTLVPWCALMGATIPVAMFAIRRRRQEESSRSFSFLYLANVLGAVAGAFAPLILIELYGFHGTLRFGAALNGLLAVSAASLTLGQADVEKTVSVEPSEKCIAPMQTRAGRTPLILLFSTGLTSMAIEVVWIRQFTPYLSTVVYAFALILGSYLAATFIGSRIYRRWSHSGFTESRLVWVLLGFSVLLPLITADPGVHIGPLPIGGWVGTLTSTWPAPPWYVPTLINALRLVLGICPFSAILGFVTPMLVDRWSTGDPDRAGTAYAVNVVGCILGPLLSGFVLLPLMNERWVLFVFAVPWLLIGLFPNWSSTGEHAATQIGWQSKISYVFVILALVLVLTSKGYEDKYSPRVVLRDNTATIIAHGTGMDRRLKVNGVGITALAPITKVMAHLTLASLDHTPHSALVVCFGMGTTYRSLLSWNISTTAIELVPSVPRVFWYFYDDAPQLLASPLSHVVIDDGRRYLERTTDPYDVINLDPPPPVGAAGSSLLYTSEFYAAAKQRLRPGGILEQWLPEDETMGDPLVPASVALALEKSFNHVRVFRSAGGMSRVSLTKTRGLLFLASDDPMPVRSPASLVERMPPSAVRDLLEYGPETTPENELADILNNEISMEALIASAPSAVALDDDRPVNEYFLLRRLSVSSKVQHLEQMLGIVSPASSR